MLPVSQLIYRDTLASIPHSSVKTDKGNATLPIKRGEDLGYMEKALEKRENCELKEKLLLLKTKNKIEKVILI